MRIFYFLLIIVCLHTNQSNAQCAGQVDSVFFSTSNEYCGNANGQLLITNTRGGIAGQTLQYQLNDGAAQASNVFSNLTAGNYTLVITELPSGCQYTYPKPIVVANKRSFTSISANPVATTGCNTNDGQITVVPVGGIAPNTYQLDGGAFVNTSVFINVPAGIHYIVVKDSKGCDTIVSANVPQPTGITFVNYATYPTSCTSNTGSVKIKSVTGTTPTTMQIDGMFTLKRVECLGSCGTAPMFQCGAAFYEDLTNEKVDTILTDLRTKNEQSSYVDSDTFRRN